MKQLMTLAVGVCLLSVTASRSLSAEVLPGQVDFGKFMSESGAEFVEVNLGSSLIGLVARFVEKNEPEAARLLKSIQLVRVNVIGLNNDNRGDLKKRMEKIREELSGNGWERAVIAQKEDQDVGVYLKLRDKETIQGLVVLVTEADREAVFVNIVGDIKPEQLALLGDKLNIAPLKELNRKHERKNDNQNKEEREELEK